jgi:hypothetical protein
MSYIFTYNNIKESLLEYTDRNDERFISRIPGFMTLALDRLSKDVKTLLSQSYFIGAFVPGQNMLRKPALWRSTVTWNVGDGENFNERNQLQQRSYEWIVEEYEGNSTLTGRPLYYCDDKGLDFWFVMPIPDQAYKFEVGYFQTFPYLDDTQQTNFLTQYAPQVLFYAVLLEAYAYLQNDERYASWEDKYTKALMSLFAEDKGRINDRFTDRGKD